MVESSVMSCDRGERVFIAGGPLLRALVIAGRTWEAFLRRHVLAPLRIDLQPFFSAPSTPCRRRAGAAVSSGRWGVGTAVLAVVVDTDDEPSVSLTRPTPAPAGRTSTDRSNGVARIAGAPCSIWARGALHALVGLRVAALSWRRALVSSTGSRVGGRCRPGSGIHPARLRGLAARLGNAATVRAAGTVGWRS